MSGFRYADYTDMLKAILDQGYRFVTLREFFEGKVTKDEKIVVNRIDVDVKIGRLRVLRPIFAELGIRSSVYPRLHAPGYNLLNFGTVRLLRELIEDGHEVGFHTELMDASGFLGVDPRSLLRAQIDLMHILLNAPIVGTASHGDMTPYNNLDFWKTNKPQDFGLIYEAYDARLWNDCRYVSDSEWTQWKSYDNGVLRDGDRRPPHLHAAEDGTRVLYLLTHPESWYEHYIHE